MSDHPVLWCWRHPRARGADGRCIGSTDLPVDPRKARRLAHRIRAVARREGLPREVWVSPLQRARAVGAWLRRWGWRVHVDARLAEMDFGSWDGRAWADVPWAEVEAWSADLLHRRAGGHGDSVAALRGRVEAFVAASDGVRLVVRHGGWINALLHVPAGCTRLDAAGWPPAPPHGALRRWPVAGG
jgi:alpha-ribazole phosphatase